MIDHKFGSESSRKGIQILAFFISPNFVQMALRRPSLTPSRIPTAWPSLALDLDDGYIVTSLYSSTLCAGVPVQQFQRIGVCLPQASSSGSFLFSNYKRQTFDSNFSIIYTAYGDSHCGTPSYSTPFIFNASCVHGKVTQYIPLVEDRAFPLGLISA